MRNELSYKKPEHFWCNEIIDYLTVCVDALPLTWPGIVDVTFVAFAGLDATAWGKGRRLDPRLVVLLADALDGTAGDDVGLGAVDAGEDKPVDLGSEEAGGEEEGGEEEDGEGKRVVPEAPAAVAEGEMVNFASDGVLESAQRKGQNKQTNKRGSTQNARGR